MLPGSVERLLAAAAQTEVETALAGGGPLTSKPIGEVSSVRTMTLDGFSAVASAWTPILRPRGYRISLQAVFCHSRPQVTFTRVPSPHAPVTSGKGRCELADLLVVVDETDKSKTVKDRRAVLIQAKLLKGATIKPSGKEWIQHELLAWRPGFDFLDPGYKPSTRDFNVIWPPDPANSAEYGGIDLHSVPPVWNQWLISQSTPCFVGQADFGPYLAGMVVGRNQYGREAFAGGADDWSFTVDELLRVTGAAPIVSRAPTVRRGVSAVAGFVIDTAPNFVDGGRFYPPGDGEGPEWPDGPISTVHISVGPIEE